MKRKEKKLLWVYGVILFISALAVLILTALNQNNNNRPENMKDIKLLIDENNSLKQQVNSLKAENEQLKNTKSEKTNKTKSLERAKESFDFLLKADNFYKNEEYVSSAKELKEVIKEDLGEKAEQKYRYLKSEVYIYATKYYYKKGIEEVEKSNYEKAETYFKQSLNFDDTKYYEENSLFYLVLVNSRQEQFDKAKQYTDELIKKYPDSEYVDKAKKLNKS